ncbi:MAG: acetylglutamate kinase [Alphaproteobacteria bacterium]
MKIKSGNAHMTRFFANAFYHSKFQNSVFVVKASGDLIEDDNALESLMRNIRKLTLHGIKVILVYGGGKATDKALQQRGIDIRKENGRRITDHATLEVMKEVIGGALSLKIFESLSRHHIEGYSLNAVPADWLDIELRSKKPVDYGFVGDITFARPRAIKRLFKVSNFVAVPCLAPTKDGQLCNINADTIATELAIGAEADKLIFLSNVDGVLIDGKTAFMITDGEIPALIEKGIVTDGMRVKMENCVRALHGGVKRIHLINGLRDNALEKEIFESVGPGTMLITEGEKIRYLNEVEIQKAIGV